MRTLKKIVKYEIKITDSGECCANGWDINTRCKYLNGTKHLYNEKNKCNKYNKELINFRVNYKRCNECIVEFGN